ncbi:MAG TPA: ABC transporter ATP-binding protein [Rectinemataceae bacterium]|nr:ABC transporter ATP-binding protein [Rectinemataceae bacterium]
MKSYDLKGIKKRFGRLEVLHGVNASFERSSVTAVLGPSGCGKTTLLNIIAGILEADEGSTGDFPSASFSYSFQEPRLLPWLSSLDNLLFALSGLEDKAGSIERAQRFLKNAGLGNFADEKPSRLSGGMKRRLSLARAFAYPSDVLLLDEAFSSVDLKLRIELMDLFSLLWREEKRTAIFVTHDIQDALYLADQILVLSSRPAKILDRLEIPLERESRRYASRELIELEERLYRQILL